MILITVTHPRFWRELRFCLESYRRFNPEPFEWLLLTEAENVTRIQEITGDLARVEAMDPEAEVIRNPYFRQQAAKLFSCRKATDLDLVITDDDTEAIMPWSRSTLFDGDRARIWYRRHALAYWAIGQRWVFPGRPERDFQLLLPFSIRRETLQALAESVFAERAMVAWRRSEIVSEFMVMGEYAWRHDPERAVFLNSDTDSHWSFGKAPRFRDWEGFRKAFKRRIIRR